MKLLEDRSTIFNTLLLEDKRNIDYKTLFVLLRDLDENLGKKVAMLFSLRDWFFRALEFDANSGEPLPSDMTSFLDRLESIGDVKNNVPQVCDWIYKIFYYCGRSMSHIFNSPRTEVLRFHERMRTYQAKEIDSAGIIEISRRPGRTVREKLSAKPTVLAVKRRQSVDTSENRLLKAFAIRMTNILENRLSLLQGNKITETEDSECQLMYNKIRRWLKSNDAAEIGKWGNLPPNNILLCDKHYKKIWRSWQQLLCLDEQVKSDWENLDLILARYVFWNTLSILQSRSSQIFQSPLDFDYNKFSIKTRAFSNETKVEAKDFFLSLSANKIIFQPKNKNIKSHSIKIKFSEMTIDGKIISADLTNINSAKNVAKKLANSINKNTQIRTILKSATEEQNFAAIDFGDEKYPFALEKQADVKPLPFKLLHQFWDSKSKAENQEDFINLDCAVSPAIYEHSPNDAFSLANVKFTDILFESEQSKKIVEKFKTQSAFDFMNSLRTYFNTSCLYYLLPDYIEDFSLGTLRSAANSVFASANPVPQSIGAVFALQNDERFAKLDLNENDFIFVIEKKDNLFSVTPIQSKKTYESESGKKINLNDIPEIPSATRWEHHPPIVVRNYDGTKILEYIKDAVQKTEGWRAEKKIVIISPDESIKNARLELPNKNWIFINTAFSAPSGMSFAAKLQNTLQEKYPESSIPLWSEHLPILQMTVMKNGKRNSINLTQGKTVLPLRGKRQTISINERFTLLKNVDEYHFRLMRGSGDNADALKYEACLVHSAFPLKADTKCRLEMSYTYGDEQPFELSFIPETSAAFNRAKVQWKEIDESKFECPNFPEVRRWDEFVNWTDSFKNEPRDLSEWMEKNLETIGEIEKFYNGKRNTLNRHTVTFNFPMQFNKNYKDKYGTFVDITFSNRIIIRFYKNNLPENIDFSVNYTLSFKIDKIDGKNVAKEITKGKSLSNKFATSLTRRFRFPEMQLWNNNSVLKNPEVPQTFKDEVLLGIDTLQKLLDDKNVRSQEKLWNELLLFASVMHEDAERVSAKYILNLLEEDIDFEEDWKLIEQKTFILGYFIGNAESDAQKTVFDWACNLENQNANLINFKLQILCIALWRSEKLLEQVDENRMQKIFDCTKNAIDFEFKKLNKESKDINTLIRFVYQNNNRKSQTLSNRKLNGLRSCCELLFALSRSRQFGEEYQKLFSPFNDEIKDLIKQIENIYSWLQEKGKILFPRQIRFAFSDNQSENNSENPLLDYLLQYLDGEKSSEMPKIESATEDAQDSDEEKEIEED